MIKPRIPCVVTLSICCVRHSLLHVSSSPNVSRQQQAARTGWSAAQHGLGVTWGRAGRVSMLHHHMYADNATDHAPGAHGVIDCDGTEIWWVAKVPLFIASQLVVCRRLVPAPAQQSHQAPVDAEKHIQQYSEGYRLHPCCGVRSLSQFRKVNRRLAWPLLCCCCACVWSTVMLYNVFEPSNCTFVLRHTHYGWAAPATSGSHPETLAENVGCSWRALTFITGRCPAAELACSLRGLRGPVVQPLPPWLSWNLRSIACCTPRRAASCSPF
jgi:hypothetical protein